MATWEDGPEYAPLERPDEFADPSAATVGLEPPPDVPPPPPAPIERPAFDDPGQPVPALASLVPAPPAQRDPQVPFDVATSLVTAESSAWASTHWSAPGSSGPHPAAPALSTPALSTPALSTPALSTPALSTPALSTPAPSGPIAPVSGPPAPYTSGPSTPAAWPAPDSASGQPTTTNGTTNGQYPAGPPANGQLPSSAGPVVYPPPAPATLYGQSAYGQTPYGQTPYGQGAPQQTPSSQNWPGYPPADAGRSGGQPFPPPGQSGANGQFPAPGTPQWFSPGAYPPGAPLPVSPNARTVLAAATPGVLVTLVVGGFIAVLAPVTLVVAFLLSSRMTYGRKVTRTAFAAVLAFLGLVGLLSLVTADGLFSQWWDTVAGWACFGSWVMVVASAVAAYRALKQGRPDPPPTPRR